MKKCSLEVNSIETLGLLDGPGVRVVVFLNNCNLRCLYCHNPETWCCRGKEYTIYELYTFILKYREYIRDGGVTFSGGEPLLQSESLFELIKLLKSANINVAIDTAGYIEINNDVQKVIEYSDLIIMDIKAVTDDTYHFITGGSIKKQDDFIECLNKMDKDVWLRQVIIPSINDTEEYINNFNNYISKIKHVKRVELLGYHSMARNKYQKLNISYRLANVEDLNQDKLKYLQDLVKY